MTAHVDDSSTHPSNLKDSGMRAGRATGSTRPRWLLPAVVGAIGVAVLVWYGILSPSAVLSGGLIGGMLLMHAGGHGGHAGKGGHGDGAQTGPEEVAALQRTPNAIGRTPLPDQAARRPVTPTGARGTMMTRADRMAAIERFVTLCSDGDVRRWPSIWEAAS